jgi:hypothetical protein
MKHAIALPALLMLSLAAWAAGPKTRFIDHSSELLIDGAEAIAVMAAIVPAKVWKLYPAGKFAFSSQVEGGMKGSTCVIAARVMLLPVTATTKAPLFRPEKTATAFDALANSSLEACKTLARDKLKEATGAVVSDLVKT